MFDVLNTLKGFPPREEIAEKEKETKVETSKEEVTQDWVVDHSKKKEKKKKEKTFLNPY